MENLLFDGQEMVEPCFPGLFQPNQAPFSVLPAYVEVKEQLDVFDKITIKGRVLNQQGEPVAGLLIETWHASKWGLYGLEFGPSVVPADPDGQEWNCQVTNGNGEYEFIMENRSQDQANTAPAIDIKITDEDGEMTLTRLYLLDKSAIDPYLENLTSEERQSHLGTMSGDTCKFDIRIGV